MDRIRKYFPSLDPLQLERLEALKPLYEQWNSQINVISRKDMENFYIHHVLHSLGIATCISFVPGTTLLDVGTGGGFPGIPLAIVFPESRFHLVDSIGKKIKVVTEVSRALQLENVSAAHERAEQTRGRFDFVISRAVTTFGEFIPWVKDKIAKPSNNTLANGILYLKGGDLSEELKPVRQPYTVFGLNEKFEEPFFDTKKVVHIAFGH